MGFSSHNIFKTKTGYKIFGINSYGQLGLYVAKNIMYPINIDYNIKNIKRISLGYNYTMFLLNDGTVKGCGYNIYGQLGIGNTADQTSIVTIPITGVKEIVCGGYHTMFLMNDGTVKGCGGNTQGQLGLGHTDNVKNIIDIPIDNVISDLYSYIIYENDTINITENLETMSVNYDMKINGLINCNKVIHKVYKNTTSRELLVDTKEFTIPSQAKSMSSMIRQ